MKLVRGILATMCILCIGLFGVALFHGDTGAAQVWIALAALAAVLWVTQ